MGELVQNIAGFEKNMSERETDIKHSVISRENKIHKNNRFIGGFQSDSFGTISRRIRRLEYNAPYGIFDRSDYKRNE